MCFVGRASTLFLAACVHIDADSAAPLVLAGTLCCSCVPSCLQQLWHGSPGSSAQAHRLHLLIAAAAKQEVAAAQLDMRVSQLRKQVMPSHENTSRSKLTSDQSHARREVESERPTRCSHSHLLRRPHPGQRDTCGGAVFNLAKIVRGRKTLT